MSLTESTMLALESPAPDFSLPATDGGTVSLNDFTGQPLLVMFICNHCPYVKHLAGQMKSVAEDYADRIAVVGIQSNDTQQYPDDSFEKMKQEVIDRGYPFAYLLDQDQQVAKAYTAACTPDFFLFDADHKLAYRGRFDSTRPTRIESGVYDSTTSPATGSEIRAAIDAVLAGQKPSEKQYPALGCNIKWSPGNEPDYFSST